VKLAVGCPCTIFGGKNSSVPLCDLYGDEPTAAGREVAPLLSMARVSSWDINVFDNYEMLDNYCTMLAAWGQQRQHHTYQAEACEKCRMRSAP